MPIPDLSFFFVGFRCGFPVVLLADGNRSPRWIELNRRGSRQVTVVEAELECWYWLDRCRRLAWHGCLAVAEAWAKPFALLRWPIARPWFSRDRLVQSVFRLE